MYNIVFKKNNCLLYLEVIYNFDAETFLMNLTEHKSDATIFEIIDDTIKYGENYLLMNLENNGVIISKNTYDVKQIISIKNNFIETKINDKNYKIKITNFKQLMWENIDEQQDDNDNEIYATIEKYEIPYQSVPINIIVLGCIGIDTNEIKYLKSKINKMFQFVTITNTLNHIFHSWKHTFSMYLGYSALDDSSTVKQLRYKIDYYLKKGHKVNLFGHGYGGAMVIKALSMNQSDMSFAHFGYLTKYHIANINTYTFGSYIISNKLNIQQYVLINDNYVIVNNKLNNNIKNNANNNVSDILEYENNSDSKNLTKSINYFDESDNNKVYFDNAQNINWIECKNEETDKTIIYLDIIIDIVNNI